MYAALNICCDKINIQSFISDYVTACVYHSRASKCDVVSYNVKVSFFRNWLPINVYNSE